MLFKYLLNALEDNMKLNDNIYVLKLQSTMNPEEFIYPTLIKKHDKILLIDTGNPGQFEEIKKAVKNEGLRFDKLVAIILTHQDIDHVGSAYEIINEISNVQVLASEVEEKYINGTKTPTKLSYLESNLNNLPEQAKTLYEKMKNFYNCNKVNIDLTLKDGYSIPGFEELVVIDTAGHTPGHISLYDKESKTLIVGDAFIIKDDNLNFTASNLNFDDELYLKSIKKLSNYDINTIICYHGGVYNDNVNESIKNLANKKY